tara:strand:+ start:833 stop:1081 length:249 start_codon:yes stop_codon:yes gene_type:complete
MKGKYKMTNRKEWLKTTMTNEERQTKILELAEKKYILNESLNLHEESILNSSIKNVDETKHKQHQIHIDEIEEERIKKINSL